MCCWIATQFSTSYGGQLSGKSAGPRGEKKKKKIPPPQLLTFTGAHYVY